MAGRWIKAVVALGVLGGTASVLWGKADPMIIDTSWAVRTAVEGNVFADDVRPEFTFRAPPPPAGILRYEVKDWLDAAVGAGTWDAKAGGALRLKPLPCGWYTLVLHAEQANFQGRLTFAVVPSPAKRRAAPDSPYAADTVLSWLACPEPGNPRQPADSYQSVADLARLAGVAMAREMTNWNDFAPFPTRRAWEPRYQDNARRLSANGIPQVVMFHDAPAWAKERETPGVRKLPDDLPALYEFAKTAGHDFAGRVTAWEFWNEETASEYCSDPAWDFATAQKVAYLGFKAGNPQGLVLNGSFPSAPTILRRPPGGANRFFSPPRSYETLLFDNGIGDYFDVFNYHLYELFTEYPLIVGAREELLAKHGLADVPSWITELGSNYEGYGEVPTHLGDWRMELKDYQSRIVAEFVPKSQIIAQSLGVARSFHFAFPAYNEGKKVWGLLNWDYTAKPGYVAFANLTYRLGGAHYEGTVDLGPQLSGFLYRQPGGAQTLVFWSRSELDDRERDGGLGVNVNDRLERPLALAVAAPAGASFALADIMGRETPVVAKDGRLALTACRFPAYLTGPLGLKPATPAPAPKRLRPPPADREMDVVFKLVLGQAFAPQKTCAAMTEETGGLILEVYNFGAVAKTGRVAFTGTGRLEGLPDSVTVPPHGKTVLNLRLAAVPAGIGRIAFSGVFNGRPCSPLYAPVWQVATAPAKAFAFDRPDRWQAGPPGTLEISHDPREQAVKFVAVTPEACDAVPEYALRLPAESLRGAVGVVFEIRTAATPPPQSYASRLAAVQADGTVDGIVYPAPSTHWTTRFVYFPADAPPYFDPAQTTALKIGLALPKEGGAFWLRKVRVIYK
jgi:hypothetical protein